MREEEQRITAVQWLCGHSSVHTHVAAVWYLKGFVVLLWDSALFYCHRTERRSNTFFHRISVLCYSKALITTGGIKTWMHVGIHFRLVSALIMPDLWLFFYTTLVMLQGETISTLIVAENQVMSRTIFDKSLNWQRGSWAQDLPEELQFFKNVWCVKSDVSFTGCNLQ